MAPFRNVTKDAAALVYQRHRLLLSTLNVLAMAMLSVIVARLIAVAGFSADVLWLSAMLVCMAMVLGHGTAAHRVAGWAMAAYVLRSLLLLNMLLVEPVESLKLNILARSFLLGHGHLSAMATAGVIQAHMMLGMSLELTWPLVLWNSVALQAAVARWAEWVHEQLMRRCPGAGSHAEFTARARPRVMCPKSATYLPLAGPAPRNCQQPCSGWHWASRSQCP